MLLPVTTFLCFVVLAFAEHRINIIQTSDLHSTFDTKTEDVNVDGGSKPLTYGGYSRIASAIGSLKDTCTIVVDTGDQFFGSVYFTAFEIEPLVDLLQHFPYDAMTFGNHEFDLGYQKLEEYVNRLSQSFVNTSLDFSGSSISDRVSRSKIIELTGCKPVDGTNDTEEATVRVGIIGSILGYQVEETIFNSGVAKQDELEQLKAESAMLKTQQGVDIVVLLSHMGLPADGRMVKSLPDVDIIIGGHSHITLTERTQFSGLPTNLSDRSIENPVVITGGPYPIAVKRDQEGTKYTIISHVGAYGQHIGYLPVLLNKTTKEVNVSLTLQHAISSVDQGMMPSVFDMTQSAVTYSHPLFIEGYLAEDIDAKAYVAQMNADLEDLLSEEKATTEYDLIGGKVECSAGETGMGDMIADAYKYSVLGAQVAFLNAGGIRGGADAPTIIEREVYEALPFDNVVTTFDIEGKYIRGAIEKGMSDDGYTPGEPRTSFLQLSGVIIHYDLNKPSGSRLESVRVCNHATPDTALIEEQYMLCDPTDSSVWSDLNDNQVYKVVSNAYLSDGNDGQTDIRNNAQHLKPIGNEIDMVNTYLETVKKITMNSSGDGRMKLPIVLTGGEMDEGVVIGVVIAFMLVSLGAGLAAFLLSRKKNKKSEAENLIK